MKSTMNLIKGMAAGLVVGGAVSAIAMTAMKPKKKNMFKRRTANAIDTVGAIMQNIADYTR